MATPFRIATYNVENLFSRARVINLSDPSRGDAVRVHVEQDDAGPT